ncbi:MAG TPA: hypothetical protein PK875_00670, partial [Spirochaetota bacterium]|nr:hypothetical protein [Spirochaetota bacterium]
ALLISAYQAIIPVVANLKERNPESIRAVYLKAYSILYYLAILVYTVLLVAFPGISMVWIGYKEPLFIFLGQILAVAWFLNTLSVPAYVFSLGLGVLKWNVIGHMVIGMLNLLAGYLCGLLWGITGVVSASFLALVVGSLVISYPILVANNLRASSYLPKESRMMTVSILLFFSVISFARILWGRPTSLLLEAGVISATVLFLALVGVKNPMRKSVLSWVCRAAG